MLRYQLLNNYNNNKQNIWVLSSGDIASACDNLINVRVKREIAIHKHIEIFGFINYW